MAQETLAKARRLPSKTNRNRKAHDGILQWSSLWFTLGLRRWSLWRSRTHTNPGHRQGDAVAERRWVNISTSLWRRRRGKDLALGFYSIFFLFFVVSWQLVPMREWGWEGKSLFLLLYLIKGSWRWADFRWSSNSWSEETLNLSLSLFLSLCWQYPMRQ